MLRSDSPFSDKSNPLLSAVDVHREKGHIYPAVGAGSFFIGCFPSTIGSPDIAALRIMTIIVNDMR